MKSFLLIFLITLCVQMFDGHQPHRIHPPHVHPPHVRPPHVRPPHVHHVVRLCPNGFPPDRFGNCGVWRG